MKTYKSKSGKKSGVIGYEIGNDFIKVKFSNRTQYLYSYLSAGISAVEIMKKLAVYSEGLSTFISQNKPSFEKEN
jgi:hypothetical protein